MTSEPETGSEQNIIRPGRCEVYRDLRTDVQTGSLAILDAIADEWRALCGEASNDEPFYRPEWIRAYVRAFAPDANIVLVTCHSGKRLTGVLPLISERGFFYGMPVRVLRSASNVHSCRFDLLRARGPEGDAAVAAVWQQLKGLSGWDVLEFRDVPEDGALIDLVCLASGDRHPWGRWESMQTPWIPLQQQGAGESESWPAEIGAKFRGKLRRTARRLAEQGALRLRRIDTADPQWLRIFYGLEGSGWKGAGGTAIDCHSSTRHFYDEVASVAEHFGYLSLYFLECGGRPVAGQYGLTYGGRYFMPKLAMDEDYKRFGPGHLLIEAIARDCVERGLTVYDFIGPRADYKVQWTQVVRRHHWLWVFRDSLYGHLLRNAKFAVLEGLKRAIHGACGAHRARQTS